MPHPLTMFDQVRIINLVDRADRRREMCAQLDRIGGLDGDRIGFFPAQRPADDGGFPSIGARGCFESHLAILRAARDASVRRLLILEDDLDFSADFEARGPAILADLAGRRWSFAYGSHSLNPEGRGEIAAIPFDEDIVTTAFVAFDGAVIPPLIAFLEGLLSRAPGSPDYGPMHVDGAYSVFRRLHPDQVALATFPPLGFQRSSRSDVTATGMLLDRLEATRPLANLLRRARDRLRG